MSLSHWAVACRGILKKLPICKKQTGSLDASAIHGRLGAQVALLQSLILPTARQRSVTGTKCANARNCKKCNLCAREKVLPMYRNFQNNPTFQGWVSTLDKA